MSTPAPAVAPTDTPHRQRLAALRASLAQRGLDAFCVPRADEYLGEYLPPHNERLLWLTGFTGSAGMAVVLRDRAAVFVDGRYTVQVARQVDAQVYEYCHLTEEPPLEWLGARLPAAARVLVDARMVTLRWAEDARRTLQKAGIELVLSTDNPIDEHWIDRPRPRLRRARLLGEQYTGESSACKRRRLGQALGAAGADAALIFAPDSVSWLLNVRGQDVPCLPVLLSFAMLEADGRVHLSVDPARVPEGFHEHVGEGVTVTPESRAEDLLKQWSGKRVLADPDTASAWTQLTLRENGAELLAGADPVLLPKACKNATEVQGARVAHRRDAVAEIRFLAWLDGEVAAGRLHDEATLSDRLLAFRRQGEGFVEPSFDTISAAAANGALCHYNHRHASPARLEADSLYLVDSGAHYAQGTTDITRTLATGTPSTEMRELFTLVLKGHIALDRARFPRGTTGTHLDALARQFLWRTGRDYDHGTGHGVGAFLSVHEGPQRIAKAWNPAALEPGMIVSNEPGYYRDGAFGIRCENLLVVREIDDPGHEVPMLGFEALTLAPFDRRLIEVALLSDTELEWLNTYHARVREEVGPLIAEPTVQDWLTQATQPLRR